MKKAKNRTWTEWPTTKSLEWPFEEVDLSFPMKRPIEGKAKIEKELIDSIPVLENEECWSQRIIDEMIDEQLTKISENENVNKKD